MIWETGVQSQVKSDQRLKKWYLMLNIQHYKLRIKGKQNDPGKGLGPSIIFRCSNYWKVALGLLLTTAVNLLIYLIPKAAHKNDL